MSGLACPWLCGAYSYPSGFFKFPSSNTSTCSSVPAFIIHCSNSQFTPQSPGPGSSQNDLKFVLHDALDAFGVNTTHARISREGFCSQIRKLSDIERGTSICINRGVDLGQAALHIAAEDDSLISHSSVPLPVADFLERLDHLSMEYCSHYSSSFKSSPEHFIHCLETYLYVNKVILEYFDFIMFLLRYICLEMNAYSMIIYILLECLMLYLRYEERSLHTPCTFKKLEFKALIS